MCSSDILSPILNCDHCIISCKLSLIVPKSNGIRRNVWRFKHADFECLNLALASIPWNDILDKYSSVDESVRAFSHLLFETSNQFIPYKEIVTKPKEKPWMNNQLKLFMRKRDRAFKKFKRTNQPHHHDIFRKLRNKVLSENRKLKFQYNNQLESSIFHPDNSKEFWHLAKSLLGNQSCMSIPPLITVDNSMISDNKDKANLFNQYFASQCMLPISANAQEFGPVIQPMNHVLSDVAFDVVDIYKILLTLKTNKATGPDQIGNTILKNCAAPLSEPFPNVIFKKCIKCNLPRMLEN